MVKRNAGPFAFSGPVKSRASAADLRLVNSEAQAPGARYLRSFSFLVTAW